jgi:TusA-related sulfurtransferase
MQANLVSEQDMDKYAVTKILDCIGDSCPVPVIKTNAQVKRLAIGDILELMADDPASEEDMKSWAKRTGQGLLEYYQEDGIFHFFIEKLK